MLLGVTMAGVITGIAWYRRPEWPLLRGLAVDSEMLPHSYDEWLLVAQQTLDRLVAEGQVVRKVDVSLAELVQWCSSQGRPLDEPARSAFVEAKLRDLDRAGG
ncbi:MAG: hypothetical protein N3G20_06540 [Verrucomicrobiae bacterium]|nr:hypothetical protein [Verrucomicrobiae bacterium]